MVTLLSLLLSTFSVVAGACAGRAFFIEDNKRKGWLLTGMWATIYVTFLIATFTIQ